MCKLVHAGTYRFGIAPIELQRHFKDGHARIHHHRMTVPPFCLISRDYDHVPLRIETRHGDGNVLELAIVGTCVHDCRPTYRTGDACGELEPGKTRFQSLRCDFSIRYASRGDNRSVISHVSLGEVSCKLHDYAAQTRISNEQVATATDNIGCFTLCIACVEDFFDFFDRRRHNEQVGRSANTKRCMGVHRFVWQDVRYSDNCLELSL